MGTLFSVPTQILNTKVVDVNEQEVLALDDLEIPDVIRSAENQRPVSPNFDIIEQTLSEDIMDIVNQQKPGRKRLSEAFDVSQRLAKVPRLDSHETLPLNVSLPTFDVNANVVENFVEEVPDILVVPPQSPQKMEKKIVKARKKKRKLVIDKIMKISDDEIKENVRDYTEKLTETSPMADFAENFTKTKFSVDKLFTAPGTRLKFCAGKNLLPLFLRNLKVLKRKAIVDDEEGPPVKKRKLQTKKAEVDEIVIPEAFAAVEDLQMPKNIQIPDDLQIPLPDLEPIVEHQKIKKAKKKSDIESETIRER